MSTIQITDERPLNIYRTEIPNIVFDVGLNCFELALYAHLRRTAGPGGECTKGVRRLAEETGMSTGQVSEIRRKLCEARSELGGKPLIRVEEIGDDRCKVRHRVTIVDIWRENFARFDRVHPVNTPVQGVNAPCSPDERKKELTPKGSNAAGAAAGSEPSMQSKIPLPPELDNDDFLEAINLWISERRKRRIKPYTDTGFRKLLADLARLGSARAIAAINHSIAQGYQGIFESHEAKKAGTQTRQADRNSGTFNAGTASKFAGREKLA